MICVGRSGLMVTDWVKVNTQLLFVNFLQSSTYSTLQG